MSENLIRGPVADRKLKVYLTLETRTVKENGQIQSYTDFRAESVENAGRINLK